MLKPILAWAIIPGDKYETLGIRLFTSLKNAELAIHKEPCQCCERIVRVEIREVKRKRKV